MKRFATTLLAAGLLATSMLALPPPSAAAVNIGVSIGVAPPPLPVYAQPVVPGPGYIWTPGYWAWGYGGYYWIPGTWAIPPAVGLLWTPGWWGWSADRYRWHAGYWGPRVGFYGGINYGFGYFGIGYVGGYWRGRDFYYNRAVNNVNITNIRNVYVDRSVVNHVHNRNIRRISYNGGRGGIEVRPTADQREIAHRRRWAPTPMQVRHRDAAVRDPSQRYQQGQGKMVFATRRPDGSEAPHPANLHAAAAGRAAPASSRQRRPIERPRGHAVPTGTIRPGNPHMTDRRGPPRDQHVMATNRPPHQQNRPYPHAVRNDVHAGHPPAAREQRQPDKRRDHRYGDPDR